jgi:hypothetical protein
MDRRGTKQWMRRHWKPLAVTAVVLIALAGTYLLPRIIILINPAITGETSDTATQNEPASTQGSTEKPVYLDSEQLLDRIFRGFSFPSKDQAAQYYEKIPIEQRDGLSGEELSEFIWLLRESMSKFGNISAENAKITVEKADWKDLYGWKPPPISSSLYFHSEWILSMMMSDRNGLTLYKIDNASDDEGHLIHYFFFFLAQGKTGPILSGDYINGVLHIEDQLDRLTGIFKSGNTSELRPFIERDAISKEKQAANPDIYQRKADMIMKFYKKYIEPAGEKYLQIDNGQAYHTYPAISKWDFFDPIQIRWFGDPVYGEDIPTLPDMMYAFIDPHGQLKVHQMNYYEYNEAMPSYDLTNLTTGKTLRFVQEVHEKELEAFFGSRNPFKGPIETDPYEGEPKQMYQYGECTVMISGENCKLEHNFSGTILGITVQGDQFMLGDSIAAGSTLDDVLAAWPLLEDWLWPEIMNPANDNPFESNKIWVISLPPGEYCGANLAYKDNMLFKIDLYRNGG